uniref:Uncharacterized protein n=1 Tax=Panagrolaimus superbus TaxID=310955 RepID=A0A914Z173_9BILA
MLHMKSKKPFSLANIFGRKINFQHLEFESLSECLHVPFDEDDDTLYMDPLSPQYVFLLNHLTSSKFLVDLTQVSPDLATSQVETFNSVASGIYRYKKDIFSTVSPS